ncbi:MAG: transglycosylase SLT domain-containing protein [Acidobacteria bacterium]|nr:transglycosylase SLT domain-containing protein [Acidobacteriota bacterium]
MRTSFPRLLTALAIISILTAPLASVRAQGLPASSLRTTTPNDIERDSARVPYYLQLVERIFRMEVPTQATSTASQAVVASNATAQPAATTATTATPDGAQFVAANDTVVQQPPAGFLRDQSFEPSPLDELSKLELTAAEKNVTDEEVAQLEQAKSAINFGFNTNPLIQQWINYFQGRGRATVESGLRRSGRFMPMARKIFREEGVPEDLAWLGQIESAWKPNAYSYAAASGLWQFVPSTGLEYGLRQTAWVDERNSLEKATHASARYLKFLGGYYHGNWELALAAYNTGYGNVDRAISRAGTADFWRAYPYVVQQTRDYVPKILATIVIARNPEKYGFHNIRPDAPLSYDVVNVPSATSLQLVASATDTSVDYLRSINPELKRDVTPRGESYNLRVPAGHGRAFVALLKRVPADRRESARVVSVAAGEDLNTVAARTGTSVAQLQIWNAGVDVSRGGKLVVPAGSLKNVALVRARPNVSATASSLVTVKARAGETIAQIAARYGADAEEVARLNAVATDAPLVANQMIKVPSKTPAPATGAPARRGR